MDNADVMNEQYQHSEEMALAARRELLGRWRHEYEIDPLRVIREWEDIVMARGCINFQNIRNLSALIYIQLCCEDRAGVERRRLRAEFGKGDFRDIIQNEVSMWLTSWGAEP